MSVGRRLPFMRCCPKRSLRTRIEPANPVSASGWVDNVHKPYHDVVCEVSSMRKGGSRHQAALSVLCCLSASSSWTAIAAAQLGSGKQQSGCLEEAGAAYVNGED